MWVAGVEPLDRLRGMLQGSRWFPRALTGTVTFPIDKIFQGPTADSGVKDFFDFVFL